MFKMRIVEKKNNNKKTVKYILYCISETSHRDSEDKFYLLTIFYSKCEMSGDRIGFDKLLTYYGSFNVWHGCPPPSMTCALLYVL